MVENVGMNKLSKNMLDFIFKVDLGVYDYMGVRASDRH
ncbi:hypothetical protein COLO4_27756 [Corchorus olitorius]|uniref:Uncharacterized protein n=1 Tax=Corchorus olitorius TaxID=93759 RepID=A0A1R3HP44_9ROSI|nr:hypothetical protein COLO4_27756 [Corchorus olitorius]